MSTVTLRRFRWWDIPAVAVLERALFAAEPWSEGSFWSELAGVPQTRHYLVAEQDGGVIGYAGLSATRDEADVYTIGVDPRRQGAGLGRRLLDALLVDAQRRDCRQVHLEVRAGNSRAQLLYERNGFEVTGVRRRYYPNGDDAVLMRRTLRPLDRAEPANA